ncbi:MAG: hypothetical protein Q8R29_03550 [bacterium]|nr:hypothetical protein [bacterium]
MQKGFLIALEGTDGSGKGTQARILVERLNNEGIKSVSISFPQYGHPSASAVEAILKSKEFAKEATKMHPERDSLAFAFDRAAHAGKIKKWLRDGLVVVADRYVDSNAAHQGGKIKNLEKRKDFVQWLYSLEYDRLKIPRPDLVLVLDVVPEIANRLIDLKQDRQHLDEGEKRDAHERDYQHIVNSHSCYKWIIETFVSGRHVLVDCMRDGKIMLEAEIHNLIWKEVQNLFDG